MNKSFWIVFLFLMVFQVQSYGQVSEIFQFYGKVRELHSMDTTIQRLTKNTKNTRITLYKHGKPIQTGVIGNNGRFALKLLSNEIYKLEVSQDLYASQMMLVDTKLPEDYDSIITPYYFEVKIFPYYSDIRLYEVLEKPTKKLHFDANSGTFKDDGEYFRQYQLAYENCENAVYNFSERINKIFLKQSENDQANFLEERAEAYEDFKLDRMDRIYGSELKAYLDALAAAEKKSGAIASHSKDSSSTETTNNDDFIEQIENLSSGDELSELPDDIVEQMAKQDSIEASIDGDEESANANTSDEDSAAQIQDTLADGPPTTTGARKLSPDDLKLINPDSLNISPYQDPDNRFPVFVAIASDTIIEVEANQIQKEIQELQDLAEEIYASDTSINLNITSDSASAKATAANKEIEKTAEEIKAKQEEKINDIKLSIEFTEMATSKKENQIELNKVNAQETENKQLNVINQFKKAKSKRKLLEIIAEAKTDLKKQNIKAE